MNSVKMEDSFLQLSFIKRWGKVTYGDFQKITNTVRILVARSWGTRSRMEVSLYKKIPTAETTVAEYSALIQEQNKALVFDISNSSGHISRHFFKEARFIVVEFFPQNTTHLYTIVIEFKGTAPSAIVFSKIPVYHFFFSHKMKKIHNPLVFSCLNKALDNHIPCNPAE
jgi:hypothetical protein